MLSYFEQLQKTFHGTSQTLTLYAAGAVDFVARGENCGAELYSILLSLLQKHSHPQPSSGSFSIQLQALGLNVSPDQMVHHLGFDVGARAPVREHIPLEKEKNLDHFGPQCAAWALHPEPICWVSSEEEALPLDVRSEEAYYIATRSLEREDMRKSSTTPEIEPEEYYENSRTAILWIRKVFPQYTKY
jgi:hypothetical protein